MALLVDERTRIFSDCGVARVTRMLLQENRHFRDDEVVLGERNLLSKESPITSSQNDVPLDHSILTNLLKYAWTSFLYIIKLMSQLNYAPTIMVGTCDAILYLFDNTQRK